MDRINIRFFDRDLNFIGELDGYAGVEFASRWTKYGTFKVFVDEITPIMQQGHYIMLNNDHRKTGIIRKIQCRDDNTSSAEIAGYTLLHLLTQRITYPPSGRAYHVWSNAAAEDILYGLVTSNAINAANKNRNIPHLVAEVSRGRGERLYYQTRYDPLGDAVQEICEASGLGVVIELDPEEKRLVFKVLEGVDRSSKQSARPPMIFNPDYDNVTNRDYVSDLSEYKNCAITAGQGDGEERQIHVVNDTASGYDRYELFVDARDIENADDLPDRGNARLAEYSVTDSYSSSVDASQYQDKWNLGDVCTTIDREYGVWLDERVVEVLETFDETGYEICPTFGSVQNTILEKVQNVGKGEPIVEGIKGKQGEQGLQGLQGEQGYSLQYHWDGTSLGVKREDEGTYQYQDLQGLPGKDGAPGPEGKPGKDGAPGPQGQQGEQGIPGEPGSRGERGEKGEKGDPGEKGDTGAQGPKGDTGASGPEGKQGIPGTAGITPTIGDNGNWYLEDQDTGKPSRGATGPRGATGAKGDTGPQGPKGEKGDTGTAGPQGPAGPKGEDGTKIYAQASAPTGVETGTVWIDK